MHNPTYYLALMVQQDQQARAESQRQALIAALDKVIARCDAASARIQQYFDATQERSN
jgi:hypothetical protein